MLNVVYVLVSNSDDYFFEQLLVSVKSLKYRMKSVHITLLTEQCTEKFLLEHRQSIYNIVNEVVVCKIDNAYDMTAKSRILKTKMRNLIEGDFLYIDCDTVICESLELISNLEFTSAALDNHQLVNTKMPEFAVPIKRAESMGYSVGYQSKHFNSGVLWCKDDERTRQLFVLWQELWEEGYKKGILADQLSLNESNARLQGVLHELNGRWNCQLRYGLPYLAEAKIIHYFASNFSVYGERKFAYKLTDINYLKKVREEPMIPYVVNSIIEQPRLAFHYAIIVDTQSADYEIICSNIGAFFRNLYKKHKKIFLTVDYFLGKIRKFFIKVC